MPSRPAQVLAYLGRYTHRVAIANSRLISVTGTDVTFRWKDYRHYNKSKLMTLSADAFIRRFLMHTLPDGFHRIRHYGFPRQWPPRGQARALSQAARRAPPGTARQTGPGNRPATRPRALPVLRRHHGHPQPAEILARLRPRVSRTRCPLTQSP